ncbi:DNA polymerase III PolC [Liquorilactobacillus sucicola DSM 21376 = JCM 15457]|uniref:DNA polymerase III PolC-type n=1 Tax=Liquorilactobacillus sucicola DSM 21376 = JCM 15457 TaxID=1423806 RepID=A0A0R2DMK7_9LACO|nr:DNA polymerase III PolC [Liquorilactobacillus sucicola DSM 21376 = JCM 15457]
MMNLFQLFMNCKGRIITLELDKQSLFRKLLEQIKWEPSPEQEETLAGTEIKKVEVHRKSQKWGFVIQTNDVWPFSTFLEFWQHLKVGFKEIAETDIIIKTVSPHLSDKNLGEYWEWVVKNCEIKSSLVQELCNSNVPYLDGNRVMFIADNEVVKNFLTTQALGPIEQEYQKLGFPSFSIQTLIDASKSQKKINEFKERKAKSDAELAQKAVEAIKKQNKQKKENKDALPVIEGPVMLGKKIDNREQPQQMVDITEEERSVIVQGYIFDKEVRKLRSSRELLIIKITDYSSSIVVKKFSRTDEDEACFNAIQEGQWVKVRGSVQEDNFMHDLVINAYDINQIPHSSRQDTAPQNEKRAELHLHTNMSMMDATNSITSYVEQAAKWGQKAIAVTDHSTLQAFPEAHIAGQKNNIKILYGVEANVVDDGTPIGYNSAHIPLRDATYVVFDTETTGLSARYDKVIELSAVKMNKGNVIAQFEEFIDPGHPLSQTTINLTSITDDMVRGSKSEAEVFKLFQDFCKDCIIVGHNATFDVDFMNTGYARHDLPLITEPWIDTLTLARLLYPQLKSFRLNKLTKMLNVNLEHHHRAIYDAEATGHIYFAMLKEAEEKYHIEYHDQLNDYVGESAAYKHEHPFHATILAVTQAGLKNLFKLASLSMVKYFYRIPRIPRSELTKYREGLIIGSACSSGEVFTAMMQKGYSEAKEKAMFYDYLEIQPKPLYAPLLEQELVKDSQNLEEIIKNMVDLGKELKKPVVATGDVHFMNKEDAIYRKILIHSQGGANPLNRIKQLPDAHFRTTDEMLAEFSFLGEEDAKKVVVTDPNAVVDMADEITPVKDKLYTPKMDGAEDQIKELTMDKAHELYGDELPEIVQKRLDKELKSVIGNGFSVIYLIAQKLVFKSNKDGYLVGSRGSVGSSLVATMAGITEVNPLPPHYRCPKCKWSHFYEKGEYGSGYDLPEKKCPECKTELVKDGHDIPFETFLGFYGNKVPDIDLNFSGDYQPIAHNYTKVLFGEKNVYRAGTIGTVADKTAYGYVKAYERDTEQTLRNAEIDRLAKGATGVKRTTGQHPAGIIVVPDYMDIYDFTPIQYPADDLSAAWQTTHFDFHSIHDNILKLDILGHDDPTMIRMLQDLSGIDPKTIPPTDPGIMQLFSGTEILNVTPEQINSNTGTLGIPEFGTRFVRGMLEETEPKTFSELLKISGLSHGTDVWLGNAEELIKNGTVTMPEVIGCRDDIMMDLIHMGVEADRAFKIMEHVRKGRGIPDDWQKEMREAKVPEWYIEACLKIKYMFPKAHAAAYVMMALRIAYFKVYFPLLYYSAYFSVRADDFDLIAMSRGKDGVKAAMKEITDKGMDASTKEKNLLTVLELANEMLERGFNFQMVNIKKSEVSTWKIEGNSLIAPFDAVPGLGTNVAKQVVAAREEKPFLSKEDLAKRGKVSKTLIDFMTENHVLDDLPDENQLSLFDSMF